MLNKLPPLKESPSQTAGPYVHIGLTPSLERITEANVPDLGAGPVPGFGPRIIVAGRVFDGSAAPVSDAVVELWQADADGNHGNAFGRVACDGTGAYRFDTVKPGRVGGPDGKLMAPHLTLWIVARGINIGLHTRVYFEDEAEANETDFVLNRIMDVRRRKTLIAVRSDADGKTVYTFDIRLQGGDETVFFDI
ncbi:protocatechuate 3,4-dioxygenase subunit alpha [Mesorhizobium sp. YC-39]|uniref:protocatechuate 3,4-dioxygenase subunit alpha n=1 Tax=unclassified Mesorhizobium TaxID=325217 RepID=UPI0021E7BB5B|nr:MULTISPECIES: protocatechuate 3,4-dioxygenase subunit alpha [unclassified Mesorhizobium]MCV3211205.1 protocatechuate 3,4-dioxygenase subunit alpha [Mesorhizobium sp. YC-2]MCV3232930.1 protocatechuate 3,4-dioxygenase subunit alpha [Mesorhizobium sp. YC-39]